MSAGGLVRKDPQPDLKIILLGDSGVGKRSLNVLRLNHPPGKTSIVSRYISSVFEGDLPATIGALFQLKTWRDKKFCIWVINVAFYTILTVLGYCRTRLVKLRILIVTGHFISNNVYMASL